jgi:hypothetical protein
MSCRCSDPILGRRYGPDQVCWDCWARAHGSDGSVPEPTDPAAPLPGHGRILASRETRKLIDQLEVALGPAVATPECIGAGRARARYRVFRWCCPACGGGTEDLQGIYRPFAVDSDGHVWCSAPGCREDQFETTVRNLIGVA